MAGGGSQNSLRKYLGALKDSTTVGLAKVNSDYKELDVAIVKATNHVERPAKEKHIKAIFAAISASRPRADVAYCIHALARRLSKTHNWVVALKTLTVIHRALREVDPTFREELINYGRTRNHLLNMSHFKDDSSQQAWEYSAWVRSYALFLEEKLECCRVLKYDIETEPSKTRDLDTIELLEQLPALQQLLFRLLGCQPQESSAYNLVVHPALSMVASESIKLYNAIDNGTINLVDKFFEMQRHDAVKALEIYRKAGQQVERLSEFYEVCKSFDVRRGEDFIKIEQAPASFLTAMEEYVKDTPRKVQAIEDAPKVTLQIEYNKPTEVPETPKEVTEPPEEVTEPPEEAAKPPSPPPEPAKVENSIQESNDLLGLSSDANPVASELDSKNAMALAILPTDNVSSAPPTSFPEGETTGWELALVTAPSTNESAETNSMLGGRLDRLTLDSLYDDHDRRINQPTSYDPWQPPASGSGYPMQHPAPQDPFHGSSSIAAPINVQTAMLAQQQQALMLQQQQQASMLQQQQHLMMNNQQPFQPQANPFGNYNEVGLSQTPNSYSGLI